MEIDRELKENRCVVFFTNTEKQQQLKTQKNMPRLSVLSPKKKKSEKKKGAFLP